MINIISYIEMQIKTAMKYHNSSIRIIKIKNIDNTSIGKDKRQLELLNTVYGNVKWHNHFWRQFNSFL